MKASESQANFLATLFIDCGFTLVERKAFLTQRFGKAPAFLDELEGWQAHKAISELIEIKEGRREREAALREESA